MIKNGSLYCNFRNSDFGMYNLLLGEKNCTFVLTHKD